MGALELIDVTGPAGAEPPRVAAVTLSVQPAEVLAVVGPSGAGKTSLLRLVAGLEPLAAGQIWLSGRRIDELPAARRAAGLVTAGASLQPHLDVAGNIELPLRLAGVPASERRRRVEAETNALGLRRLLRRRPAKLSAGARRAAAVAREVVRLPGMMLLDEPGAHLDADERARLRHQLGVLLRGMDVPAVVASNDHTEAMAVGDRLAVMDGGRIVQLGRPQEVYDEPATPFVAGFLGDPGANLLDGHVEVGARTAQVRLGGGAWAVEPVPEALRRLDGAAVTVAVRPEHLSLESGGPGVAATVDRVQPLGDRVLCHVTFVADGQTLVARVDRSAVGSRPGAARRSAPAVGETVEVVADPRRLRVFAAG